MQGNDAREIWKTKILFWKTIEHDAIVWVRAQRRQNRQKRPKDAAKEGKN